MEVTLTITTNLATGETSVDGPLENRLVSYGMLELARVAIDRHNAALADKPGPRLVPVNGHLT